MSGPIARVMLTLAAASDNRTAIDIAVRLAAQTGASLHGVFVEDQDLLHLAALPFARQVTIGRGTEPLSRENIALQLRAEAERTRQELLGAAKRRQVECTFEIAPGTTELRGAGASERELMITGGSSGPIAGHFRVEHRWWSSLETTAGPFLLARFLWTTPGSVVILLRDRDAASARLFDTAAQIAAATDSTLAVLCAPPLAGTAGIKQWIAERAAMHPVRVQVEVAPAEPAALRERLGQLGCRLVALDAGLVEGGGGLRSLVERFSCDMLVVP